MPCVVFSPPAIDQKILSSFPTTCHLSVGGLKLTASLPLNIGRNPKGKDRIPTISGAKMLVFLGMVHEIQYLHCGMGTLHFTVEGIDFQWFFAVSFREGIRFTSSFFGGVYLPTHGSSVFYSRGCFLRWGLVRSQNGKFGQRS